jgi:hypothetical protein
MTSRSVELRPRVALAIAAVTLAAAACGGDLTLPSSTVNGVTLSMFGGNGQTGSVGDALPAPVVLLVKTEAGEPLIDRRVVFLTVGGAGDRFDSDTVVTDSQGRATNRWVLGTTPGQYSATARVAADADSAPSLSLTATAVAGPPDTLRAIGPTNQPGRRGSPVGQPLAVRVLDRFGNPVGGAQVAWATDPEDGRVSAATTSTAADGSASVTWTLGNRVGTQKATATVAGASGSPLLFTSFVLF